MHESSVDIFAWLPYYLQFYLIIHGSLGMSHLLHLHKFPQKFPLHPKFPLTNPSIPLCPEELLVWTPESFTAFRYSFQMRFSYPVLASCGKHSWHQQLGCWDLFVQIIAGLLRHSNSSRELDRKSEFEYWLHFLILGKSSHLSVPLSS